MPYFWKFWLLFYITVGSLRLASLSFGNYLMPIFQNFPFCVSYTHDNFNLIKLISTSDSAMN